MQLYIKKTGPSISRIIAICVLEVLPISTVSEKVYPGISTFQDYKWYIDPFVFFYVHKKWRHFI